MWSIYQRFSGWDFIIFLIENLGQMSDFLEFWIIQFFIFIHFNRQFVVLLAYPAFSSIKPLVGVFDEWLTKNPSEDQIKLALCFHTLLVQVLTRDEVELIEQVRPLVDGLYFF